MRYLQIIVIALLVVTFGAAGLGKLVYPEVFAAQFAHLGLPGWFVHVTGAVELSGAVLLASFGETRRRLGAAVLAVTMAAAAVLHLLHDPFVLALSALALMLVALWAALVPLRKGADRKVASA